MKRALLILLCTLSAHAQWPTSPMENLLICNHTGEQALPKIAALSEGGCYVAWQDLSSGNYDIYLQRLDANGIPQWADPCGILVSDHPQDTWLTDWDIAVDVADNCILAINDIRNGADRDITVYSIGPQQEFLWGPDGIALSNNDGFEPDPRILPMDNGDVVFAWQEEDSIHIRKLDSEGHDVFNNPSTITFTQASGVSIPRLAALDNSGFALSYLAQQGTQFSSPRYLYVRSYNDDGSARWVESGIEIMNQSGIGIQMRPDLVSDGEGGVYVYWYDARGNVHHCYVQHVNANGVAEWAANGVSVDLSASELQMSPSAVVVPEGIAIFYQTANTAQSQGGLSAQLLDHSGAYLWNTAGVTISPLLPDEHCFNVRAFIQDDNYSVFFSQYDFGSATETLLRASQLTPAGVPAWTPTIKDMCSVESEKGRPYACVNVFGQIIAAWPDARDGDMDIYVQNINLDGELGPNTAPPPVITIVAPVENSTVHDADIDLVFEVENYIIDPDFGDGFVQIQLNDQDPTVTNEIAPYPMTLHAGANLIIVEILDLDLQPLEPRVIDSVHVNYEVMNPSITITSPQNGAIIVDSVTVHFEVEDFNVAESGGDGHIQLVYVPDWEWARDSVELFDLDPYWFTFSSGGFHTLIILRLVDNEGLQLVPPVADTAVVNAIAIISADPIPDGLPTEFAIANTYPNPFNSTLSIQYDVPTPAHVSLNVFDLTGRQIATLVNSVQSSGSHTTNWRADNFPSGLYFLRLNSGGFSQSRKIVLLK